MSVPATSLLVSMQPINSAYAYRGQSINFFKPQTTQLPTPTMVVAQGEALRRMMCMLEVACKAEGKANNADVVATQGYHRFAAAGLVTDVMMPVWVIPSGRLDVASAKEIAELLHVGNCIIYPLWAFSLLQEWHRLRRPTADNTVLLLGHPEHRQMAQSKPPKSRARSACSHHHARRQSPIRDPTPAAPPPSRPSSMSGVQTPGPRRGWGRGTISPGMSIGSDTSSFLPGLHYDFVSPHMDDYVDCYYPGLPRESSVGTSERSKGQSSEQSGRSARASVETSITPSGSGVVPSEGSLVPSDSSKRVADVSPRCRAPGTRLFIDGSLRPESSTQDLKDT